MRDIPSALQAKLDSGVTTLCRCWVIARRDGATQGFTDHDEDIAIGAVACRAGTGLTGSEATQKLGLAADSSELSGALSDDSLNEDDLAAGRYDGATVELWLVDWSEPSLRVLLAKGSLGEVKRAGGAFTAEVRGISERLNQDSGRLYTVTCSADLGDGRCTIDLSNPTFRGDGTVNALQGTSIFTASGLGGYAETWFTAGKLTFTRDQRDGAHHLFETADRAHHFKRQLRNTVAEVCEREPLEHDIGRAPIARRVPNEKIIIFLGASAAWGYGASSNDKIVHQRIEALLNERQHDVHYTVVSLAMQGWIAQQSAIALDIWGRLFQPDWVVSMNGFTDSVVGCLFSQGTGNPNNGGATKLTLMGAYQAALGRSEIEQAVLRNSALYRRVTGKAPLEKLGRRFITKDLFVDPSLTKDLGQLSFTVTPLSEVRNQTQFYLLAQQSIIERYPDAKYLVTTEAMSRDFDAMFARTPDEIEKSLDASIAADPMCSLKNGETARRYVFVRSA